MVKGREREKGTSEYKKKRERVRRSEGARKGVMERNKGRVRERERGKTP